MLRGYQMRTMLWISGSCSGQPTIAIKPPVPSLACILRSRRPMIILLFRLGPLVDRCRGKSLLSAIWNEATIAAHTFGNHCLPPVNGGSLFRLDLSVHQRANAAVEGYGQKVWFGIGLNIWSKLMSRSTDDRPRPSSRQCKLLHVLGVTQILTIFRDQCSSPATLWNVSSVISSCSLLESLQRLL